MITGWQRGRARSWNRECRHRAHQSLNLAVDQSLTIRSFDGLHLIGRARIPIVEGHLIACTNHADHQVIARMLEPQLTAGHIGIKPQEIAVACGRISLCDVIRPSTSLEQIRVIAHTTL